MKYLKKYDVHHEKSIFRIHTHESGQITVFLALMFLVLIGFSLSVVEGVKNYSVSSLAEDAVKNAGENIMANYDKELFKNYHIFFLDPREKKYILSDGKQYMNQYFSGNSIFQISCNSIQIMGEKTAVDENGLYLKHEIREWMKYREEVKIEEKIKNLISNMAKNNKEKQKCTSDIKEAESVENSQKGDIAQSSSANNQQGNVTRNNLEDNLSGNAGQNVSENSQSEDRTQNTSKNNEEKEESISPEVAKERANWKEIKEALQLLMKTGVLFYVADHPENLSKQSISSDGLPSRNKMFSSCEKQTVADKMAKFSFSDIKEVTALFSEDISFNTKNSLWTKDR